jgi:hypothetical protein
MIYIERYACIDSMHNANDTSGNVRICADGSSIGGHAEAATVETHT